ncbi:Tabersonine 6,7-epoxidase isoform 2 [Ptychographa xylographoides]|nr:Tabersonine 6,7-epoxidase isoform 2 [Ptychographa xylographoides]
MGSLNVFLLVYLLGGLTFLPLLLGLVLLHAYLTFPYRPSELHRSTTSVDPIPNLKDDDKSFQSGAAASATQFQRGHEPDVAEGYFAVCREYVPGGVNGKPPERTTPAGEVIVEESPSVYQSMYRSLFDRKQTPTLDVNGKTPKKARNVFYVVLRHGHLMLYDDSEQVEVRHVISLAHHNVGIYGGGNVIPEGELWIKRNAICLVRKATAGDIASISKPFYFFSDNCSEKEDFYFALLQNQERNTDDPASPPKAQNFEVKDIISLVQQLHSSEEQLQTRWVNALIGRLFLAIYKTQEIEDYVRMKITKKIARVKKPAFLSGIVLQKIDLGEAAPYITNPHLKDLTVNGDCCVEADFTYKGNFRLEVAATARIDLGTRFKAREVNLLLAAVIKKLEGHVLVRFKPPPSNRVWISFETMPHIEMTIEPVVSSRQITYGIILRAIESRIREVIAETLVQPHWDDSPFLSTLQHKFRGGIWADQHHQSSSVTHRVTIPDEEPEHEVDGDLMLASDFSSLNQSQDNRAMSMPALGDTAVTLTPKKGHKSSQSTESTDSGSSSSAQRRPEPPKAIRSRSFASIAHPIVGMDHINVEAAVKDGAMRRSKDAASIMTELSNRSQPNSPLETPVGSLSSMPTSFLNTSKTGSFSSTSSNRSSIQEPSTLQDTINEPPLPTPLNGATSNSIGKTLEAGRQRLTPAQSITRTLNLEKRQNLQAIGAAAAAAKKWGWNALSRNTQQGKGGVTSDRIQREGTPAFPIGRGRPLPPPGQPLPRPDKRKATPVAIPKRKSLPPPILPVRHQDEIKDRQDPSSLLTSRRTEIASSIDDTGNGHVLVVEAPLGSEPTSPLDDTYGDFIDNVNTDEEEDVQGDKTPSAINMPLKEKSQEVYYRDPAQRFSHEPDSTGEGNKVDEQARRAAHDEQEMRNESMWVD